MVRIMDSIDDLIRKAGGPKAISEASARTACPIGDAAVHKWRHRGLIPAEHWDLIAELTGVSVVTIHNINSAARRERRAVA